MENVIEKLKKEQYQYIASIGGYFSLKESDNANNDMNRGIIRAFYENNKESYIGYVNVRPESYKKIKANEEVEVLEKYNNEMVYNFGCDFIVPEKDVILEKLIIDWNKDNRVGTLDSLMNRIEELGGVNFIWS